MSWGYSSKLIAILVVRTSDDIGNISRYVDLRQMDLDIAVIVVSLNWGSSGPI